MRSKKYWFLGVVTSAFFISMWAFVHGANKIDKPIEDKKTKDERIVHKEGSFVTIDTSKIEPVSKGRDTLVGLPGVNVLVEELNPEVQKYGLMKQALQTDVELQLRRYGIKVLSEDERLRTRGMPSLYVRVTCVIHEPFAAVGIEVKVQEIALLTTRYPVMSCIDAITWEKSCVVIVGVLKIETMRENVHDLVNEFINDYLASNPRERATKKDSIDEGKEGSKNSIK